MRRFVSAVNVGRSLIETHYSGVTVLMTVAFDACRPSAPSSRRPPRQSFEPDSTSPISSRTWPNGPGEVRASHWPTPRGGGATWVGSAEGSRRWTSSPTCSARRGRLARGHQPRWRPIISSRPDRHAMRPISIWSGISGATQHWPVPERQASGRHQHGPTRHHLSRRLRVIGDLNVIIPPGCRDS